MTGAECRSTACWPSLHIPTLCYLSHARWINASIVMIS